MPERYCKIDKKTILLKLTNGLKVVATWYLHIEWNEVGKILCEFKETFKKFSPCRHHCHWQLGIPSDGAGKEINGRMVVYAVQGTKSLTSGWRE